MWEEEPKWPIRFLAVRYAISRKWIANATATAPCATHPLECGFVRMGCSIVWIAGKLATTGLRIKLSIVPLSLIVISETPGKVIEAPGWLLTELKLIRQTPPIPSLTKHVCVFAGFVPAGLVESKPSIESKCFRISISRTGPLKA